MLIWFACFYTLNHMYYCCNDDWDATSINEQKKNLEEVLKHLNKYQNISVNQMMQVCNCVEFNMLLNALGVHHVVVINNKKIINRFLPLYGEFQEISKYSTYTLDLTKPITKSTCNL